jgi:excisionase family DNA binding protein
MLAATEKLLSVREVADYLGVHPQTVYALIRNRELEALQPRGRGHSLFIEQEKLERWLLGASERNGGP